MRFLSVCTKLLVVLLGAAIFDLQAGDPEVIRKALSQLGPDFKAEQMVVSPIPGLYEVTLGTQIVYVTADGKYLLQGHLLDLAKREDITETKLNQIKKSALAKVSSDQMILFSPANPKYTITVFTDIDCGYCRKLHNEINDFMAEGIAVRYLFFPRAGLASASYKKAVSVWCAADRKQALTDAKAGKDPQEKNCDNPVAESMKLGELLGVTGTPAIILEDGQLLPGYMPAKRMAGLLATSRKEDKKPAVAM
ncbi:thiol:disulfide interchange protein DsbC [Gammaproteobacteria bacterium]